MTNKCTTYKEQLAVSEQLKEEVFAVSEQLREAFPEWKANRKLAIEQIHKIDSYLADVASTTGLTFFGNFELVMLAYKAMKYDEAKTAEVMQNQDIIIYTKRTFGNAGTRSLKKALKRASKNK